MAIRTTLGPLVIAVFLSPTFAQAQVPNIVIQGRIQAYYRGSGGDSTGNYNPSVSTNGFGIRRLRIQGNVRFGDNISMVLQPSFEMGSLRMRDAFVRVGFGPALGITVGQEKSPFQRYELNTSNNLPSIERGLMVLGFSGREALNDVLVNNGYVSHDLGAAVDYTPPGGSYSLKFGVANGSRESSLDVNNAKSLFARATATPLTNADNQPVLQLGASFADRDRAICNICTGTPTFFAHQSKRTQAFGVDLEVGGFRPGPHLIFDFASGDNVPLARRINSGRNTGNVRDAADSNVVRFRGMNAVFAWRVATGGPDTRIVKMVEPALRIDLTDPNTDAANDTGLLFTPVLNVYFANTTILRAGVDWYRYRTATGVATTVWEVKMFWQANF